MVPVLSKIRAPVKFLHLSELALCLLFAHGLALFLSDTRSRGVKEDVPRSGRLTFWFGVGCVVLAGVFSLAAIAVPQLAGLRGYWKALGLVAFTPQMQNCMQGSLFHASLLFAAGAAIFLLARFKRSTTWLPALLVSGVLLAVAIDVTVVGRPYVRVGDVRPWYSGNPVAERINSDPGQYRAGFYLGARSWRNWLYGNFAHHLVNFVHPVQSGSVPAAEYQKFYGAFGDTLPGLVRMWQLTSTRYILGPREQFQSLASQPALDVVGTFDVSGGRVVFPGPPTSRFALLSVRGVLPRAQLYHEWDIVESDAALSRLADTQFQPELNVLVTGDVPVVPPGGLPEPVSVEFKGLSVVTVSTTSEKSGILLLNDKYDADWRVSIDGKEGTVLKCNYIMRGVFVPAGSHRIVFSYRPYLSRFMLGLSACFAMLIWSICRGVSRWRPWRGGRRDLETGGGGS